MRITTTLILLLISFAASAAVYKWVKPDGTILYSDRPPNENTAPTDLPDVQEIKVVPPSSSAPDIPPSDQNEQQSTHEYTKLEITSPANDSTLRDNSGKVDVSLSLEPPLQEGDVVAITLDGKDIGQGQSPAFFLNNVDRGTHSLQVAVKDASGNTLISSSTVSFHVQRTSVLQPKR